MSKANAPAVCLALCETSWTARPEKWPVASPQPGAEWGTLTPKPTMKRRVSLRSDAKRSAPSGRNRRNQWCSPGSVALPSSFLTSPPASCWWIQSSAYTMLRVRETLLFSFRSVTSVILVDDGWRMSACRIQIQGLVWLQIPSLHCWYTHGLLLGRHSNDFASEQCLQLYADGRKDGEGLAIHIVPRCVPGMRQFRPDLYVPIISCALAKTKLGVSHVQHVKRVHAANNQGKDAMSKVTSWNSCDERVWKIMIHIATCWITMIHNYLAV